MQVASLIGTHQHLLEAPPAKVLQAIGMLSRNERAMLYNLARHAYRGEGLIIDAGLFLGASTIAFGTGLAANPVRDAAAAEFGKPIRSYELGIVNPGMLRIFAKHGIGADLGIDDSFERLLRQQIAPVADLVALQVGDVMVTGEVDRPIEILFLDLLKHPDIALFAVREHFTRLVPGVSYVIQQDYFIDQLAFIKTMQETFAPWFDFIGAVGPSALYKLARPIPAEAIEAYLSKPATLEHTLACADTATARAASRTRRFFMELSKLEAMRAHAADASCTDARWREIEQEFAEYFVGEQPIRIRGAISTAKRALTGIRLTKEELAAEGMAQLAERRIRAEEIERERRQRSELQAERERVAKEREEQQVARAAEREAQRRQAQAERERIAREREAQRVARAADLAARKAARAAEVATANAERNRKKAERAAEVAHAAERRRARAQELAEIKLQREENATKRQAGDSS